MGQEINTFSIAGQSVPWGRKQNKTKKKKKQAFLLHFCLEDQSTVLLKEPVGIIIDVYV